MQFVHVIMEIKKDILNFLNINDMYNFLNSPKDFKYHSRIYICSSFSLIMNYFVSLPV